MASHQPDVQNVTERGERQATEQRHQHDRRKRHCAECG